MILVIDIDSIMEEYILNNKPVPYKDFLIYPVKVIDANIWKRCHGILEIDKDSLNDIELIKMSYLKFLYRIGYDDHDILKKLSSLLTMCLHLDKEKEKIFFLLNEKNEYELLIGSTIKRGEKEIPDYSKCKTITHKEFEDVKKIILYQNIYEYDDSYIDPDIKEAIERYHSLNNKDAVDVTIEKQKAAVQVGTATTLTEIDNMTYRYFCLIYETMIDKIEYELLRGAELSGSDLKKPIEHWIFKKKKGRFGEAFVDADGVTQSISAGSKNAQSEQISQQDFEQKINKKESRGSK